MAVTSVGRAKGYPETTVELVGRGTQAQVKVTHQDRYEILCDSDSDLGVLLIEEAGFSIFDVFEQLTGFADPCIVKMKLTRDRDNRRKWYLDVSYEEIDDETRDNKDTAPDELEPEWSWTFETVDKVLTNDVDTGDPVTNTAGEVIDMVAPVVIPVLTIERYQESFDPNDILNYVNHRNASAFWGADPGTALLAGIEDRKDTHVVYANRYYRKVRYVVKFMLPFIPNVQEGWTDLVLNRGTYYIDSNGNKIHFKAGGSEITGDLLENGDKLPDDAAFWVFVRVNRFPEAELNDLELGPFE